ncbi:aminotransferase class V-fold PLP-dependent enzyme [Streptomyces sp. NPDC097640]|uniref:aminotransferase class V-fold PLP-dependent enzyme n=1 Tax=Streptomyces sp. NPDC097640 TaxID=3157229 RepID=UPI00331B14C4
MNGGHPPLPPGLTGAPVCLDHNAATPVDIRVAEAMWPRLTDLFGNPSSSHHYSAEPRRAPAEVRAQVAALVGARADEAVFTASGSEADLLVCEGRFHCDAAQAVGMIPLDADELGDGAPARIAALCDDLHQRLAAALPGRVRLNGPEWKRLSNTLNVSIDDALGHEPLAAAHGIAASTGSACHRGNHTARGAAAVAGPLVHGGRHRDGGGGTRQGGHRALTPPPPARASPRTTPPPHLPPPEET